jgi:hypothetical protein
MNPLPPHPGQWQQVALPFSGSSEKCESGFMEGIESKGEIGM